MDEASVSTEIFNTKDFNAVLLDQESIKKLSTHLFYNFIYCNIIIYFIKNLNDSRINLLYFK